MEVELGPCQNSLLMETLVNKEEIYIYIFQLYKNGISIELPFPEMFNFLKIRKI